MTDHPDPTSNEVAPASAEASALRLSCASGVTGNACEGPVVQATIAEGVRLVEAATRDWALSIADPISRIPPGDRSMRENALVDLAQATRTLLQSLAALTEERNEAVKRAEHEKMMREATERVYDKCLASAAEDRSARTKAEARAAAMEAALEEISGHAPVKTPPDYATSSDTGEAFDDGYSRGVWGMGQIADAALAPQAEAGEG